MCLIVQKLYITSWQFIMSQPAGGPAVGDINLIGGCYKQGPGLQYISSLSMSHLIELEERMEGEENYSHRKCPLDRNHSPKAKRLLNIFVQKLEEAGENRRLKVTKSPISFQVCLERAPFHCQYSFMSKIAYKDSENQLKNSSILLNQGEPYTIITQSMRIAGLILLQQLQKQMPYLTITIDQQNGSIQVKNNIMVTEEIVNRVDSFYEVLNKIFLSLAENNEKFTKMLRQISNDPMLNKRSIAHSTQNTNSKRTQLILKYLKVCFIELDVSDREGEIQKILRKRQLNQRDRILDNVPINICQFQISKSMALFQIIEFPLETFESLRDIIISQQQIRQFNPYLLFPKPKMNNESENEFIFNEVIISDPHQISLVNSFMKGGTAQMFAAKLKFQYTVSQKLQKGIQSLRKPLYGLLQKNVLIKYPLNKKAQKFIEHEMKILKTLKLSKSAYLIKYYKTQQKCAVENHLMMDYLHNTYDLQIYLQRNRNTQSILNKLVLLGNIANGLRFLKNYHIVHMDLTPKNILVWPQLITKIIDFGEAYCYMVCKSNYRPGFTNPYGPPEVFSQKQFSTKQDIFSFGMVMFRTLFGVLPFQPTPKLKQSYRNKTYNSKLFFAIESLEYTWLETPMLLLFALFVRCKDTDQQTRPYPTWIRVILRMILEWYKNISCK